MVAVRPHLLTDERIAAVAARQHAQISAAQLRALGVTSGELRWRVGTGRLFPVHRGVFSVGVPATTDVARWAAAVLASGSGSALAGASAVVAWALADPGPGPVEVLTARPGARARPGVTLRRARVLPPEEVTRRHGLPITTPARTLLDVAAHRPALLSGALREARVRRLVTRAALRAVLAHGPRPGVRALAAELDGPFTRSQLERRFLALVTATGLPAPHTNVLVAGMEVDALWPAEQVVVELDGGAGHATRSGHASDVGRDQRLRAAGYAVRRFTWWDVTRDGHRVAAALRADLASR